ncbi:MAG: M16 family metallopeptidase, partial [Saprospiraceae bacterium]
MKQTFFLFLFILPFFLFAQNDNLKVEVFTLENGLTVYLNEDSTVNRVFGAVAVNAGSKNDPAEATGIAHYLEHLLFKGTEEMGTWNYEAEKPLLDSISYWYDELGRTQAEEQRKIIQSRINNLSVQAAKYSLPNDFDNLLKGIGSTRVNAFTSPDMTFYHNSFPPNQILNWLKIFSHRFQKPVFRSFQSELEVVYEEKNRATEEFGYEAYEKVVEKMFEPHPYGTQTTLGKTEHLKNPSLNKMYEFFDTYYVANNMALIITGNFKSEEIKEKIKVEFGALRTGNVPDFKKYSTKDFQGKEVTKKRYTPIKALAMGYKTVPTGHKDEAALKVANLLLSNGNETGYFDQLTKENKVLAVQSVNESLNDAGVSILVIVPKIIVQSFKSAEKHIFKALDKLKNGDFDERSLNSAKQELYMDFQMELENITDRGIAIGNAFNQ